MAVMNVWNSSASWLILWLEPLGEDRWPRPGERFRIRSDYVGDDLAFTVDVWVDDTERAAGIEKIAVWVESGDWYAETLAEKSGSRESPAAVPPDGGRRRPEPARCPGNPQGGK